MADHIHTTSNAAGGVLSKIFQTYTPRRQCMNYEQDVIWLHFVSDLLIAMAYFSIPIALVYFAHRRKDLAYNWMVLLFAVFIVLCGTTHLFNVGALWLPFYRLDGAVKFVTGGVSAATAVLLWRLMPQAIALPSAQELVRSKHELERRVTEQTAELTHTNQALCASEEQFRQLAESISQLCWMANANGDIFWYNQRFYDYTGMTFEQIKGWGWQPLHDPAVLPQVLAKWKGCIASGESFEMVFPLKRADGVFRRFLTRIVPVRNPSGEVVRWFGTNTDIEDQKRNEAEIERLLQAAEGAKADALDVNRAKDEFLAVLSHELRTPLNAIVGWAKILRSGQVDGEDLAEGLDAIHRNANVQAQLIEDLLDISRIISGKLRLDVQRVDLAEVILAAIASVAPAAEAKGVRIEKVLDPLAGLVSGDPARLQQVVWNLLSNAVKFTPRGGKVQVLLERVNSHVEISVVDTGQGIIPEFLSHVFERFRQADSTTTRRFGGLGLGLAIVKQLTELHGGGVRAKSPGEGQGSTFVINLPIAVMHDSPEKVWPKQRDQSELGTADDTLDGLRVLVVDDEPDARTLVRRVLAESGALVALAASAREAMEQLCAFRPHVLVSDVGMPEEDGYDLLRQVRAELSASQLPAAALTAFARAEDRKRALMAGFQTHVAKPVDPSELVAVVASLAGRTGRS